jgi:HPt (histidine-containing phosphotransfer) domain-containing protein
MDAYLSKPISGEDLYAKIDKIARASSRNDAAPEKHADLVQPVDREALMDRVGDDQALLKEIVHLFFDDCSMLLTDMREAVGQRDAERLEKAAHSLKGSVGNFTAQGAVGTLAEVEALARRWDLFGASEALNKAEEELERVKRALAELIKEASL